MTQERKYPSHCPACDRLLAEHAKPHCDWKSHPHCSWMRCECGANIAQSA